MNQDFGSQLVFKRPTYESISSDIDTILWSFRLQKIRRFVRQKYWKKESIDAEYADRLEPVLRLETVAEHSWTVADTTLLLAPYFPYINSERAIKLAILHDKMEIITGDPSPVGRDGTGKKAHAFDLEKSQNKNERERHALNLYLNILRPEIRPEQQSLILESMAAESPESRLVKGIDKLQSTAFILLKKAGNMEDKHIDFLINFNKKNCNYFPPLSGHYDELLSRILNKVSSYRGISRKRLDNEINRRNSQLDLFPKNSSHIYVIPDSQDIEKAYLKSERINKLFMLLDRLPKASSAMEIYCQISNTLNSIEDDYFGVDSWNPPRFYPPGNSTDRMYPTSTDSMYPVPEYGGVNALVGINEVAYISRYGAVEIQKRDKDNKFNELNIYSEIIYVKSDAYGDNVWHIKNK
jgi:5'-deoxynucleotidase YfbR-like HD superfamily hydrolase